MGQGRTTTGTNLNERLNAIFIITALMLLISYSAYNRFNKDRGGRFPPDRSTTNEKTPVRSAVRRAH